MIEEGFQIAIDGPVGAGKSTVAKILAERLGMTYVYTGAMYRALALYAKQQGVDWKDEAGVVVLAEVIEIELKKPRRGSDLMVRVFLSGEEVSRKVFSGEMGEGASVVSQYGGVRKVLVEKQRELAVGRAVIMDGRDIGTNVLPNAQLKIYLDADVDERVRRKKSQLGVSQEKAEADVLTRDRREMSRKKDPLKPAKDAWIFDTTDLSINEAVERIMKRVAEM